MYSQGENNKRTESICMGIEGVEGLEGVETEDSDQNGSYWSQGYDGGHLQHNMGGHSNASWSGGARINNYQNGYGGFASQGSAPGPQSTWPMYTHEHHVSSAPTQMPATHQTPIQNLIPLTTCPIENYQPLPFAIDDEKVRKFYRMTTNCVPYSQQLLNKTKIPLGMIITPYPHGNKEIPVISSHITRCRRCRTYLNPYVQWIEDGSKYRCNNCFYLNEVPINMNGDAKGGEEFPELKHPIVEYIAPTEYMVRPPQPNIYLFIIDVSQQAVKVGLPSIVARTILDSLDLLPNVDGRTQVGFLLVDRLIHFVHLHPSFEEPKLLVMNETDNSSLPVSDNLMVNLTEYRFLIELFLHKLGSLFANTNVASNALGSAILVGKKLLQQTGGKIVILQSSIPTLGQGALRVREDPSILGTPKEESLFLPSSSFYKSLAADFSKFHICVDMFLLPPSYVDIATLSSLPKFTGGHIFYYPGFNISSPEDSSKLAKDLSKFLSSKLGLEAVFRLRTSRGISIKSYYGNFFIQQTDLLALSNVNHSHSFTIQLHINEELKYRFAYFQTALLHTTSDGERRIRVMTIAVPVTNRPQDIFLGADSEAIANYYAKVACETYLNIYSLSNFLFNAMADIFNAQKQILVPNSMSPHVLSSESLCILPLFILGILKSTGFRCGPKIPSDFRLYYMSFLRTSSLENTISFICPKLYNISNIHRGEPIPLRLTRESLLRDGLFLLENTLSIYIWVGSACDPSLLSSIFGKNPHIPTGKVTIQEFDNDASIRLKEILLRIETRNNTYPYIYIVKENSETVMKNQFLSLLIEDKTDNAPTYPQWISLLRERAFGSN